MKKTLAILSVALVAFMSSSCVEKSKKYQQLLAEKEAVVVENQNTVKIVPVTVGIVVDDMAEITSGLVAGDEVVTSGQTLLDNGSKVNVVSRNGGI